MNNGKMTRYVRHFKQLILLLVAIAILLVACSEEETPTVTPQSEPQITATSTPQSEPQNTATSTPQSEPQNTATSTPQSQPQSPLTSTLQSEPQGAVTSPLASPLATPQAEAQQVEPLPAPAGATGLAGAVFSSAYQPSKVLDHTILRLAQVQWDAEHKSGVYVLSGAHSPGTISKDDGRFLFTDVEPADYVIIVGDVIGINEVFSKPDGKPYIFTVDKGKITNVGVVTVKIQ